MILMILLPEQQLKKIMYLFSDDLLMDIKKSSV